MIEVLEPGLLTTIQDAGRPGFAHLGVPVSGAADRRSHALANRLVGNAPGEAALELTYRGPRLRFSTDACVALTGALAEADGGGRALAMNSASYLAAGETLQIGALRDGMRSYLAVRGGIESEPALGSRASDLLSGLGPPPLAAGDAIGVGDRCGPMPGVDIAAVGALSSSAPLHVCLGPRDAWFTAAAIDALLSQPFTAGTGTNRTGVQLEGPPLTRAIQGELLSEGMVPGCIEVPPGAAPVLLLRDHPTTGGYPVIAVVLSADLDRAAQLRAGQRLRFALERPVA